MKHNIVKHLLAILCAAIMFVSVFTTVAFADEASQEGTIIWLSSVTAGPAYEAPKALAEKICNELGYNFQVVFGDSFDDAAGNLQAVKNAMTSDVKGLILSQAGGVSSIMEEYPNLYVVGFKQDMRNVFEADGTDTVCKDNDKFLGTIGDGPIDGEKLGVEFANECIEKGYKKIATMTFPGFAFPSFVVADAAFRQAIEEYNASAGEEDQIEVIGDATVLMFQPVEDSWFLEDGHSDLDAIVGFCDGTSFIYPVLKTAVLNGLCSSTTQLITRGFTDDADTNADVREDGTIGSLYMPAPESIAWCIAMLDSAIIGEMYPDYTGAEQLDGVDYVINSAEDMQNVLDKSLLGTSDGNNSQITMEDLQEVMTRFNADATYEELKDLFASEKLYVEYLAQ